jgi:hypothetical protein
LASKIELELPEWFPEDVVIGGIIAVISYFDPDGRMRYAVQTADDSMNLAQVLGLLELGKISCYEAYHEAHSRDEDDDDEEDGDDDDE